MDRVVDGEMGNIYTAGGEEEEELIQHATISRREGAATLTQSRRCTTRSCPQPACVFRMALVASSASQTLRQAWHEDEGQHTTYISPGWQVSRS